MSWISKSKKSKIGNEFDHQDQDVFEHNSIAFQIDLKH
jgi:hypothetical protein